MDKSRELNRFTIVLKSPLFGRAVQLTDIVDAGIAVRKVAPALNHKVLGHPASKHREEHYRKEVKQVFTHTCFDAAVVEKLLLASKPRFPGLWQYVLGNRAGWQPGVGVITIAASAKTGRRMLQVTARFTYRGNGIRGFPEFQAPLLGCAVELAEIVDAGVEGRDVSARWRDVGGNSQRIHNGNQNDRDHNVATISTACNWFGHIMWNKT